jgi:pyruvate formate lyase activating enzyme
MSLPRIRGFLPNTLIDWPGRLAAEVFLEGCNLRCPYCHAGYLLTTAPEVETFDLEHILAHLKGERGWLDGVVVSGGEPTIHPELPGLLRRFKEAGFPVKLDTNGTQPEMLAAVLGAGLVECVAMDVKAPLDERYARATGRTDVDLRAIRRSLALLRDWDGDYELRTTVCPAVLSPKDVLDLAVDLVGAPRLVLQPFKPGHCLDPALDLVTPYPEELLLQLAERCQEFVGSVSVRGRETVPSVPEA